MPSSPARWKRLVLPLWNGGHRFAWRVGEYLGAFRHKRFERCAVCGRFGPMLYRRWVIPPRLVELWGLSPRLAEALARKESCDCFACGAKMRARRLAQVLLDLYPVGYPPTPARSVRDWVRSDEARQLQVAEINTIEGLHTVLSQLPSLACSDYRDGAAPGEIVDGVRSEDLTRLSYPDGAFDLILTSESLEHVPDLDAALSELRRVLRPGGRHLFTVPLLPDVSSTYARARVHANGTVEELTRAIRHPGGDTGYFVFTEFGADLIPILERAGFEATMWYGPPTENDLGQVFVMRRG